MSDSEFDAEYQKLLYRALERDCLALVGVVNQLGDVIDAICTAFPDHVVPDDVLETINRIDEQMDIIYARRKEWIA